MIAMMPLTDLAGPRYVVVEEGEHLTEDLTATEAEGIVQGAPHQHLRR